MMNLLLLEDNDKLRPALTADRNLPDLPTSHLKTSTDVVYAASEGEACSFNKTSVGSNTTKKHVLLEVFG